MKHLLSAASAAVILFAAGSAFAQYVPPVGGAPAAPGAPAIGAPIVGEAAVDVTVETIVAALGNTEGEIGELAALPEAATIQVVDLNEYLQGDGAATLTPALTEFEGQADAVREALSANVLVMAQLESEGVQIEDVVGFDISGNTVLIFTHAAADAGPAGAGAAGGAGGDAPAAPVAP